MLGKGLKRKLAQEEENDIGNRKVTKMGSFPEVQNACYWLQRQTVFNLSLLKLHSRPTHSDPGLARRVLITNTLRHIQDELRVEGVLLSQSLPSTASPLAVVEGYLEHPAGCGFESPPHTESSLTPVSLLEEDKHLFLALHSSVSRHSTSSSSVLRDSFSSALAEIDDLCPTVGIITNVASSSVQSSFSSSISTDSAFSSSSLDPETRPSPSSDQNVMNITCATDPVTNGLGGSDVFRHLDLDLSIDSNMDSLSQCPPSLSDSAQSVFNHTPSSSFFADFSLDDLLFTEIDNFLFDNSPCSSPLNNTSGTSKVVSMVADDLVKTLTGYGLGGNSQSALPPNQTFKLDLNELDHIMEVLVGS